MTERPGSCAPLGASSWLKKAWRSTGSLFYLDSILLLHRARAMRVHAEVACDRGELLETGMAHLFPVA